MDIFISHASEDKACIAKPLADALINAGFKVFYDEYSIALGDSLRRKIDEALSACSYGIVILSKHFFAKEWPQKELDGLAARETSSGKKIILPVWHEIDQQFIAKFSPTLADRLGISSSAGINVIVDQVKRIIERRIPKAQNSESDKLIYSFREWNLEQWQSAQFKLFPTAVPTSCQWRSLDEIVAVLGAVSTPNLNHTFLPTGGGQDIEGAVLSHEDGCIELKVSSIAYIVRPKSLWFESFPQHPSMSYFRLETDSLEPWGGDEEVIRGQQQLVEIEPLNYHPISIWDEGGWTDSETGTFIDFPDTARVITRFTEGSFVIFAKGSLYNSISSTYDARHTQMSAAEFRIYVERMISEAVKRCPHLL